MGVYLVVSLLIPAVMALAISEYLGVLNPNLPIIPTAILTIALATLIGIFNIRTNAVANGRFSGGRDDRAHCRGRAGFLARQPAARAT